MKKTKLMVVFMCIASIALGANDLQELRTQEQASGWLNGSKLDLGFIHPIKGNSRISLRFGLRMNPFERKEFFHKGIDMAANLKTPIVASASGKVVEVGFDPEGYGHYLIIDHQNGFTTKYAHLHSVSVEQDMTVEQGKVIALLGISGRTTGPHLHFEISFGDLLLNPYEIIYRPFLQD